MARRPAAWYRAGVTRGRCIAMYVLSAIMVAVGVAHFVRPQPFVDIMPAALAAPLLLVYVSGAAGAAGGLGLLLPGG